jgi:hypothetical protein
MLAVRMVISDIAFAREPEVRSLASLGMTS